MALSSIASICFPVINKPWTKKIWHKMGINWSALLHFFLFCGPPGALIYTVPHVLFSWWTALVWRQERNLAAFHLLIHRTCQQVFIINTFRYFSSSWLGGLRANQLQFMKRLIMEGQVLPLQKTLICVNSCLGTIVLYYGQVKNVIWWVIYIRENIFCISNISTDTKMCYRNKG